jgi:hypothetical protein
MAMRNKAARLHFSGLLPSERPRDRRSCGRGAKSIRGLTQESAPDFVLLGTYLPTTGKIVASGTKAPKHFEYGGPRFLAASALPLEGGLTQPQSLAALLKAVLLRPGRALALVVVVLRTPSEEVCLSTSVSGRALSAYLDSRSLGVLPNNRLCRGVLILPERHADYLRGRHRQALRTNLRRAESDGIRCQAISDPVDAFHEITEIAQHRRTHVMRTEPTLEERLVVANWRAILSRPEITLLVARDRLGSPLAITAVVIDDALCLIRVAVARSHEARWALHDHLVRILIARDVRYLVAEGGGPFGALGVEPNVHHYQRLLGYELRHLRPSTSRRLESAIERAIPAHDLAASHGSRELSLADAPVASQGAP